MRAGGCPAVVAQWQSTGGSSLRCPEFDSRRLLAFSLSSIFTSQHLNSFISSMRQDALSIYIFKKNNIIIRGLGMRLCLCMRTNHKKGVLHNGQQPHTFAFSCLPRGFWETV